jgi:hypothetical protein
MHDRTTYGLYCWSKSLFEKLGWMTLAHQDCQLIQLKCYVENIHNLIQHIELKLQYLHDLHKKHHSSHGLEEKIHDMEILHGNMKVLIKHAEHLVKTCKKEKVIKAVKKVGSKKIMKGGNPINSYINGNPVPVKIWTSKNGMKYKVTGFDIMLPCDNCINRGITHTSGASRCRTPHKIIDNYYCCMICNKDGIVFSQSINPNKICKEFGTINNGNNGRSTYNFNKPCK